MEIPQSPPVIRRVTQGPDAFAAAALLSFHGLNISSACRARAAPLPFHTPAPSSDAWKPSRAPGGTASPRAGQRGWHGQTVAARMVITNRAPKRAGTLRPACAPLRGGRIRNAREPAARGALPRQFSFLRRRQRFPRTECRRTEISQGPKKGTPRHPLIAVRRRKKIRALRTDPPRPCRRPRTW